MRRAAGILLVCADDRTILLVRRSTLVRDPGLWSTPGGMAEKRETPIETASREAAEELGPLPPMLLVGECLWRQDRFEYLTFIADVLGAQKRRWRPRLNWENDVASWWPLDGLPATTHPGVNACVAAVKMIGAP